MKIDRTTENIQAQETRRQRASLPDGDGFHHLLEREVAGKGTSDRSEMVGDARPLVPATAIPTALVVAGRSVPDARPRQEARITEVIGQLDGVLERIRSSPTNFHAVADALRTLDEAASRLAAETSLLSAEHPLRQVASELSVLAMTESVKWRRGDYLE